MHFLMFHMKRAHLSSLSAARRFCEEVGLTPARYDVILATWPLDPGTPQKEIWKRLGLSRTSVSRMVRLLIELGLLSRMRDPRDRRTFLVSRTPKGAERMRRTFVRIHYERPFQRRFERAFGDCSATTTAAAVLNLNWALRLSAVHLGDSSCKSLYRSKDDPD